MLDLATGANTSHTLPGRPGFFAETTEPGVLLVGLERRLVYFDLLRGALRETGIEVTGDERVIINDGVAVEGGVLFGTKHLSFSQPVAALYYYDFSSRRLRTIAGGQVCSNGKFLRREGAGFTLVDIDSMPKAIHRLRLDEGLTAVQETSLVAPPESLPSFPDGLRPGPDGDSVIVAFYNPAAVTDGVARQFRIADGAVVCEWSVPGSPRVTCPEVVEFGGEIRIVFTTAVEGMPEDSRRLAPGAGAIYMAPTPFRSAPAPPPLAPVLR